MVSMPRTVVICAHCGGVTDAVGQCDCTARTDWLRVARWLINAVSLAAFAIAGVEAARVSPFWAGVAAVWMTLFAVIRLFWLAL
jgi:hypothetical protein